MRFKRFIKQHRLLFAICMGAIVIFATGNIWYVYAKNNEIEKATQESSVQIAEMNAKQKEVEAQKIADAKKAEQDAAAKNAAEQAKTGSGDDSKACNPSSAHNNPASIDVIVNKKHCIQPLDYVPTLITSNGATLSTQAIDAYDQMFVAAAAAGQPFYTTSSYRSYTTQVATYNKWVAQSGQAGADTYSARPGYSEHQTGFALDVAAAGCTLSCFGSTSQYKWFQTHAPHFGFIQRYYAGYEGITGYKAEEWHYRYVGLEVAHDMQKKGIKTLEQYWNISGGDY